MILFSYVNRFTRICMVRSYQIVISFIADTFQYVFIRVVWLNIIKKKKKKLGLLIYYHSLCLLFKS